MTTLRATICNKKGLHARAAAKVVKLAATFDAQVKLVAVSPTGMAEEARAATATSILSLLMLAVEIGQTIELRADGAQADAALEALKLLIERRFDEGE